jgi:hypothetical protein
MRKFSLPDASSGKGKVYRGAFLCYRREQSFFVNEVKEKIETSP